MPNMGKTGREEVAENERVLGIMPNLRQTCIDSLSIFLKLSCNLLTCECKHKFWCPNDIGEWNGSVELIIK